MVDQGKINMSGLEFEFTLEPCQIYRRDDLDLDGLFPTYDLPFSLKVEGKNAFLVFRKMPGDKWKITEDADFEYVKEIISSKSLGFFTTSEKVLEKLGDVLSRRVTNISPEYIWSGEEIISEFVKRKKEFYLLKDFSLGETGVSFFEHNSGDSKIVAHYIKSNSLGSPDKIIFLGAVSAKESEEAFQEIAQAYQSNFILYKRKRRVGVPT